MSSKKENNASNTEKDKVILSEEDKQFKEEIDLLVSRILEPAKDSSANPEEVEGIRKAALTKLHDEIKTATSSMTSVPKPLKFLRPHYDSLAAFFASSDASRAMSAENRKSLADLLSVLAMMRDAEATERAGLMYKKQGTLEHLESWGHDYVRNIAGEIGKEYQHRLSLALESGSGERKVDTSDLEPLIALVVPFLMDHGSEPEACDLMIELGRPQDLVERVDYSLETGNFERVSLYLSSCAQYFPEPENSALRRAALAIHIKARQWSSAMLAALDLGDTDAVRSIVTDCGSAPMRRQLAFILARHGAPGAGDIAREAGEAAGADDDECDLLNAIACNQKLSELFVRAAESLNLTDPKDPEQIVKVPLSLAASTAKQLGGGGGGGERMESSRRNLALTFVNALVNCGYGENDGLFAKNPDWLFHHKGRGLASAAASLGLTMLWDVDGLSAIDKYTHSTNPFVFAGSLLAIGAVNATVRSDADPALGLILDALETTHFDDQIVPVYASLGIGLAYAGTAREDVGDILATRFEDASAPTEARVVAALALGLVFAGTADVEVISRICDTLVIDSDGPCDFERSSLSRLAFLALGLVVLGRGDEAELAQEVVMALSPKVADYARMCVVTCAYAASGNLLKIQELLQVVTDSLRDAKARRDAAVLAKLDETKKDAATGSKTPSSSEGEKKAEEERKRKDAAENAPGGFFAHGVAVLGIGLAAMGEKIGDEMVLRTLDRVLQFGDVHTRRAVPLTLGLLSVSNPRIPVVDALVRLAHDTDATVAGNAIIALGLVGAGSNNTRVVTILHTLAVYHAKAASLLFAIHVAEGLVALGKGALTLSPLHSDRQLLSVPATAGLLVILHACFDIQRTLLGEYHYLLFALATAIYPRVLLTIDDSEEMNSVATSVRVGQAVDIAGQAGRPKAITGFQTHDTPVMIGFGERAEMATEDYVPYSKCLEGVVLLKKVAPLSGDEDKDKK